MDKEQWISSILDSAAEVNDVESNPYLYYKIDDRLNQQGKSSTPVLKYSIGWAFVFLLVIAFNVSSVVIFKTKEKNQKDTAALEALSGEMNNSTTYNY